MFLADITSVKCSRPCGFQVVQLHPTRRKLMLVWQSRQIIYTTQKGWRILLIAQMKLLDTKYNF